MKKLTLILSFFTLLSCSYVPYNEIHKSFLEEEGISPDQVQFYNANRIVLWKRNTEKGVDKKKLENTGKIDYNKIKSDGGFSLGKGLGVRVKRDKQNSNILYVITDKDDPNKILKFMRLSEADNKIKNQFIDLYNLESNSLLKEVYYLIPDKISTQLVHKKIRTKSSFWRRFQKKRKNINCGTVLWGEEEYQVYFKKPTFLMISRDDDKNYRIKIKKHKGNYIKNR